MDVSGDFRGLHGSQSALGSLRAFQGGSKRVTGNVKGVSGRFQGVSGGSRGLRGALGVLGVVLFSQTN